MSVVSGLLATAGVFLALAFGVSVASEGKHSLTIEIIAWVLLALCVLTTLAAIWTSVLS